MEDLGTLRAWPDEPPESLPVYPISVAYAMKGSWEVASLSSSAPLVAPGCWKAQHTIALEIHVCTRTDLARNIKDAMSFGDTVPVALLGDMTLAATVDVLNEVRYTFGPLEWSGQKTLGWRFEIDVEMMEAF